MKKLQKCHFFCHHNSYTFGAPVSRDGILGRSTDELRGLFIIKRGKIEDCSRSQFVMVQRINSIRPRRSYKIYFVCGIKKVVTHFLSYRIEVVYYAMLHIIIILGNDIIKRLWVSSGLKGNFFAYST